MSGGITTIPPIRHPREGGEPTFHQFGALIVGFPPARERRYSGNQIKLNWNRQKKWSLGFFKALFKPLNLQFPNAVHPRQQLEWRRFRPASGAGLRRHSGWNKTDEI